ncbi:4'-phosphopantetheinyl transferase family protein [Algibacter luteus]|uniref:4'-phosphopantetheinyl transferase family protein n=1 Tax=Algibacter luteus TaxID=1178825 RepID=UPI002593D0D2|nr:4'-phosphopantetheinyl transferase superfamily protein [Algibacter luteus]WJJ95640.1 4'-phosphopantetheinyl transferase superfamily protein [Algibacter luteus]
MSFSVDKNISLDKNEIHIWFINFNIPEKYFTLLNSFLSEDEILKASKFKFEKDKNCSIITRGALRLLSGKYLNLNPQEIEFKYGDFGKPAFNFETPLKFNVSHSGNIAVLGFCLHSDIGVDIEVMKANFDVFDIASNYFSSSEIEALKILPTEEHTKGFYRCWTRKESFIKAKAKGLSFPLDSFSVSIDSDIKAELLETKWDNNEKEFWKLFSFSPQENYIGAVSVKGQIQKVNYFNFKEFFK